MTEPSPTLPSKLRELIGSSSLESRPKGRLGASIYRVALPGGGAYLKVASLSSAEDLAAEHERLCWLNGKLPAPRPLYYGEESGSAFLLVSQLPGEPGHHSSFQSDPARLLRLAADGLRQVHSLPIENCPFQSRAEQDLADIDRRLARGLIDRVAFAGHNAGMTPEMARDELASTGQLVDDLVFTHGDYYLPNILVEAWSISGFIDVALAGVADRYRDLTAMADSIRMNLGERWVPSFVAAYGLDALEPAKVRYYTLLDQFFTDFGGSGGDE